MHALYDLRTAADAILSVFVLVPQRRVTANRLAQEAELLLELSAPLAQQQMRFQAHALQGPEFLVLGLG
jgi:hypothetical protein